MLNHAQSGNHHTRRSVLAVPVPHILKVLILAALVAGTGLLIYFTGGLPNAYAHFFYLPVLLAAYWYGAAAAALTGVVAGLVAGPLMLPDPLSATQQSTQSWLTRLGFLAGVGAAAGYLMTNRNFHRTEHDSASRELSLAYRRTLQSFTSLVALRDEQTGDHCERVAHNAVRLGTAIGLDADKMVDLYWAGILHDLGKISTPAQILLKPGALTSAEFAEVKKHVEVGAETLRGISPRFENIAAAVRSHHERWDGLGYPDGKAGADIPILGRILHVIDVFEAVTSHRPYRDPMPTDKAIELIHAGAGTDFDPELVAAFEDLYARGQILLESDAVPHTSLEEYPLPGHPQDATRGIGNAN